MIPSTDLRLKTMMRSLQETILPALDPQDSLAKEQIMLLMGHVNALIQQQGLEHKVKETEADAMATLARFLLGVAEGGPQITTARIQLKAALEGGDPVQISLATHCLICAEDASQDFKEKSWQPILAYAKASSARGKEWFKPMGF